MRNRKYDPEKIKRFVEEYVKRYKEKQEKEQTKECPIFTESITDRDEEDYVDFVQKTSD